jgi:glycosyltransferase involved in cell wall biosynthesis
MPQAISAIITTYNYGRFIAGAVESVLQQSVRPDEILVVDDGSTDGTADIVAGYAAAGVRYVSQANGGAGAARNRGLRETRGELVAFLDGDDRWLPDKLARQLDHLHRYPSVGLITGGECQVFEGGQASMLVTRPPVGAARFYPQILIENTIGNPSLTLIRRACFKQVGGFDESLRLGQDWDMWIRIAKAFPIGVVAGPLILFTQHANSLTAGRGAARYASNQLIHRRYISQVASPWQRLSLWRAAQAMNCYYRAAAIADDPAERSTAWRMALAASLLDPFHAPRLKLGVLFRATFGRAAFDRLRGGGHPVSDCPGPASDR